MNDEASSTTAPATNSPNDTSSTAEIAARNASRRPVWEQRKLLLLKKTEIIGDLMFKLDIIIYTELVFLYYLDCSFFRFILRVLAQVMFLTPKPQFVPPSAAKHRPYVGAIFGPNAICALLHVFTRLPQAGETTRGYLHGGIIIDFIGQKPPGTRLQLVLLDVIITFLQCFMLAVHAKQDQIKGQLEASKNQTGSAATATTTNTSQDQDAEERGISRDAVTTTAEGIELQEMRPQSSEVEGLLSEEIESEEIPEETSDIERHMEDLYSGNTVLEDFHVLHTLRTQWNESDNATSNALNTVGASAGYSLARVNVQLRRFDSMR